MLIANFTLPNFMHPQSRLFLSDLRNLSFCRASFLQYISFQYGSIWLMCVSFQHPSLRRLFSMKQKGSEKLINQRVLLPNVSQGDKTLFEGMSRQQLKEKVQLRTHSIDFPALSRKLGVRRVMRQRYFPGKMCFYHYIVESFVFLLTITFDNHYIGIQTRRNSPMVGVVSFQFA